MLEAMSKHLLVFWHIFWLVGGLEHEFYFLIYWVSNHPKWLSYFSEGWPNHQPVWHWWMILPRNRSIRCNIFIDVQMISPRKTSVSDHGISPCSATFFWLAPPRPASPATAGTGGSTSGWTKGRKKWRRRNMPRAGKTRRGAGWRMAGRIFLERPGKNCVSLKFMIHFTWINNHRYGFHDVPCWM